MANASRVLVVDDEESLRHMLSLALAKDGFQVWTAKNADEALLLLRGKTRFHLCVTDIRMPGMDGLAFIQEALRIGDPAPTFLAMSAYGDQAIAIEALRRGAFDYISKPFKPEELSLKLRLVLERDRLHHEGRFGEGSGERRPTRCPADRGLQAFISRSDAMKPILSAVVKVARYSSTVLITGETGTGKERIAEAIHAESPRSQGPFVPVNCGAIPENLLESELFGHAQGAFTDAKQARMGLFEVADGGSLFLDEIGELPATLQVKLLRALVEGEIRRVGESTPRPVDVRVISATARDLKAEMEAKRFREDLFYRLNVVALELPPLRSRPDDITLLADHFLTRLSAKLGVATRELSVDARRALVAYDWPGNVRELENALERAIVLSDRSGPITLSDLDDRFHGPSSLEDAPTPSGQAEDLSLKPAMNRLEAALIQKALKRTSGNRTHAAELLGISHRALLYKMKDHNLR